VGQDKDSAPISEETFLAAYDPGEFDRPSVTVDVALLSTFEGHLETVLSFSPSIISSSCGRGAAPHP
jgi:hypothetical protein